MLAPAPGKGVDVAPGAGIAAALYSCVRSNGHGQEARPISLEPRVETLCRRHPEMGPCQYERQSCRLGGGRVYTARGEEITLQHEREYDRRVLRMRFQAN
jgi:hypothetical protein